MSNIVRYSIDEIRSMDFSEELERLGQMPDDQINTDDIPERHFNMTRAIQRRGEAWQPGVVQPRKAS